ncbi:unnamed protein product [Protopolystoma xenopodis]|uniref:Ig-like domain-containing protein n=1 Tax=Protopolystoma xenopodis TaxID=117903 RepID=A0A3S5A5F6_9PLAT|nr:unnamed protein product [Protopolystoma xenopodis]
MSVRLANTSTNALLTNTSEPRLLVYGFEVTTMNGNAADLMQLAEFVEFSPMEGVLRLKNVKKPTSPAGKLRVRLTAIVDTPEPVEGGDSITSMSTTLELTKKVELKMWSDEAETERQKSDEEAPVEEVMMSKQEASVMPVETAEVDGFKRLRKPRRYSTKYIPVRILDAVSQMETIPTAPSGPQLKLIVSGLNEIGDAEIVPGKRLNLRCTATDESGEPITLSSSSLFSWQIVDAFGRPVNLGSLFSSIEGEQTVSQEGLPTSNITLTNSHNFAEIYANGEVEDDQVNEEKNFESLVRFLNQNRFQGRCLLSHIVSGPDGQPDQTKSRLISSDYFNLVPRRQKPDGQMEPTTPKQTTKPDKVTPSDF